MLIISQNYHVVSDDANLLRCYKGTITYRLQLREIELLRLGDVHLVLGDLYAVLGDVYAVVGDVHAVLGDVYMVLGDVYAVQISRPC